MLPRLWFPDSVSSDHFGADQLRDDDLPSRHAVRREPRIAVPGRGAIAVVLLVFGVLFFCLYFVLNGSEHHSFNSGATPPASVHITQGKVYEISTPGGVVGMQHRGLDPNSVSCSYTEDGGQATSLQISPLGAGTRTTHAVSTFIAPVTGDVRLDCTEMSGGVFVDDADNGAGDPAGLFLLLATIAISLAVPLGMSFLYKRSLERPRHQDQVETVVDPIGADVEISDPYRGDIGGQLD
jgi:hypothetical protein